MTPALRAMWYALAFALAAGLVFRILDPAATEARELTAWLQGVGSIGAVVAAIIVGNRQLKAAAEFGNRQLEASRELVQLQLEEARALARREELVRLYRAITATRLARTASRDAMLFCFRIRREPFRNVRRNAVDVAKSVERMLNDSQLRSACAALDSVSVQDLLDEETVKAVVDARRALAVAEDAVKLCGLYLNTPRRTRKQLVLAVEMGGRALRVLRTVASQLRSDLGALRPA